MYYLAKKGEEGERRMREIERKEEMKEEKKELKRKEIRGINV